MVPTAFSKITNKMFSGRTSATQSGRIAVAGLLDINEIRMRKEQHQQGKTIYTNASLEDHCFRIEPGELLLTRPSAASGKKRSLNNSSDLLVFSSLNGIKSKVSTDEKKDLEEKLRCLGFADIVSEFNSHQMRWEDALVQIQGVRTTRNTGSRFIKTGDLLVWSLPSIEEAKRKHKIVASLTKFDPKNDPEHAAMKSYELVNKLVARALSSAKPGAELDVLVTTI